MPELPKKKVGLVACSGEELAEGTVTRLAALKVLEHLRPSETVTICLPLFLAGGEGDRAFAKFYPTIAIDGCEKRCAYRGTEMYSNRPAASVVVTELVAQQGLGKPEGRRKLNESGRLAVEAVAQQVIDQVDDLLEKRWNRREGQLAREEDLSAPTEEVVATCACGSGIPIQKVFVDEQEITLVALPLIFQNFQAERKTPCEATFSEMMETVRIYNQIESGVVTAVREAISREYQVFWNKHEALHG